jgi:hypothetical protein
MLLNAKPTIVTQEMLRNFKRLRESDRELRLLRDEIRTALENGALIESGPLSAELVDLEQRRFTAAALEALFDAEWIEAIRPELPVTVITRVRLVYDDDELDNGTGRGLGKHEMCDPDSQVFDHPSYDVRPVADGRDARRNRQGISSIDLMYEAD